MRDRHIYLDVGAHGDGALFHDLAVAPHGDLRSSDLGALIVDAETDGLRLPDDAEARRLREHDAAVDLVALAGDQRMQRRDGEVVEQRTVAVGTDVKVNVPIPHAGANIIEIEASPLENELTQINNRAVISIDGVRDKLRVLLVSGEPHAGERTWRNLLKSDASVDLVHFTILRPPEIQDGTPINELSLIAFPTRELFQQKISEFQLIIFDRYARQGVLPLVYFDNIAKYVLSLI